jgi:hypothetical protein
MPQKVLRVTTGVGTGNSQNVRPGVGNRYSIYFRCPAGDVATLGLGAAIPSAGIGYGCANDGAGTFLDRLLIGPAIGLPITILTPVGVPWVVIESIEDVLTDADL